jgi:hypothetical protein
LASARFNSASAYLITGTLSAAGVETGVGYLFKYYLPLAFLKTKFLLLSVAAQLVLAMILASLR